MPSTTDPASVPWIAPAAERAAAARLLMCAEAQGVAVRSGRGWCAVRTGVDSNDLNGVVSDDAAAVTAALIADLVGWLGAVPASWLSTGAGPRVTAALVAAGARPERTGSWSGRLLPVPPLDRPAAPIEVVRVGHDAQLDQWLGLADRCGWIGSAADRARRRELYLGIGLAHPQLGHWLALDRGRPVGFASSHVEAGVVDLCNLAVLESDRRRGIGQALVRARLDDAVGRGATTAVSAPSPDGWQLQRALGFISTPVRPDRCFYFPVEAAVSGS